MKKTLYLLILLTACTPGDTVLVNQSGYYPGQEKVAVVDASFTGSFRITDVITGTSVFEAKSGDIIPSPFSSPYIP